MGCSACGGTGSAADYSSGLLITCPSCQGSGKGAATSPLQAYEAAKIADMIAREKMECHRQVALQNAAQQQYNRLVAQGANNQTYINTNSMFFVGVGGGGSGGGGNHAAAAMARVYAAQTQPVQDRTEGVPSDGIKVGEIVGWRCWVASDFQSQSPRLLSCHTKTLWVPGEPMKGDVKAQGVHAWNDRGFAEEYAHNYGPAVIGSVALWGDVVEHKNGYRAEFARPASFDMILGMERAAASDFLSYERKTALLQALRELYLAPKQLPEDKAA